MALYDTLQITVYRADTLARVGLVTSWISLSWTENYAKSGMMQLEVIASAEITALLCVGRYCGLSGRSALMWIRNAQMRDGKWVVTGYTLDKVLEERVYRETIPAGTAIESRVREIIEGIEPWPCMELGDVAGIEDVTGEEIESRLASDAVFSMLEGTDAGIRVRHDREARKLKVEMYRPGESGVKYGAMYGNVGDVSVSLHDLDFKNVALVEGAEEKDGDNVRRISLMVGDTQAEGSGRRETYIDASSVQRGKNETDESLTERIRVYGETELAKMAVREAMTLTVIDRRAEVGSVIRVTLREIGMRAVVRITGIRITAQRGKIKRELITGDPYNLIRRSI